MGYLFRTVASLVGATGWFDVYIQPDNSFYCRQTTWHEYQSKGHGDFSICKSGKKWKLLTDKFIPQFLFESLCDSLEQFYMKSKVPQYASNEGPEN